MATMEPHVNRYGLTELERPNPANVDIIFVHGLNGDPHNTWTSERSKTFWPKQLLPPLLQDEKARILVYGYDADVTSFTGDGVSRDKIHNHAESLVAGLVANRRMRKMTERPIVFIAHSLGGLVVKRALIYSAGVKGHKTDHLRDVFVSTHGVLFLGTPHHGADIAKWGTRLEWIASVVMPKKIIDSSPDLVNALKKDNEVLIAIDRDFMQIISLFHVYFFHEGKPTDVKGTMTFIVDETSASPTIQDVERGVIQASHSQMCKFDDDNSPGFELVYEAIQRYASEAPAAVAKRWTLDKDIRGREYWAQMGNIPDKFLHPESSRNSSPSNSATNTPLKNSQTLPQTEPQGDESINPEHPPKPAEPYWIVPPGFRENTFWVDRSKEMRELHQRLHDRKRRNDGTACVLVHGQAGVGKSHLARQYVNKHREKFFAGGIFWIPSKIKEEREKLFWDIHQKVVARESPELCTNSDKPFRESVKAWFEARHDWLIVFDGVVVDKDADVTELAGFVPDSKNSSIIYISLSKSLESRRRLRQPFPIRVAPLPEEHARNLLLKQLEHERKRKPTEAEKKAAMELVRKIGCLPLAIDAISHRIAETSEPLTKFNIKSYSADPKLKGTYETILKDLQLSHPHLEAWNLINILCFFGQHIPVEMVHLGLRGLPTEVKIKSSEVDGEEPNLNTTFSTLMKYALIERNPPEDKSSATSSYDSLVDPIDMLKLHSVVQKFCCDSLDASKLLPEWLTHAVELFAYSYHKADEKIKQKPEPGRISDYRDYLVHGHHLLDHTRFYEKRSQNLEVVRMQLSPVLDLITQEIRSREPSSSQESVNRAIFQISIFDRTNSSSDSTTSLPEQLRDYSSRPTILPPHYNQFGMDGQQQLDSPRSVSTASPVERRGYNHGELVQMPEAPDLGYESEIETRREALPMQNSLSDHTVRPPPRPPSPEWLIVNRKPKKPPRKDLGEFRKLHPWPATAQVKSNTTTAVGSVGQIQKSREALRPRNSDVSVLLRDIKQHSPPQKNSVLNFWQRKTPPKRPSQPTIHHHQHPRHDFNLHVSGSPMPVYDDSMERFGSRESFRTGQSSQRPSPRMSDLRSDSGFSIPDNRYRDSSTSSVMEDVPNYKIRPSPEGSRMMIDNRHPYSNNNANNQSNIPHISTPPYDLTRPRNTTNENFEPIYPSSQDGRNTAPLPIVQNVSVSRPSHFNFELQNLQNSPPYPDHPIVPPPYNQQYHHQNVTTRPSQSPYQQPPRNISSPPNFSSSVAFNQLGGYSSQPMSRDTSLTSAGYRSTAETEPVNTSHTRYPSSPPPAAMNIFASSPRDREMDGRPLRKSPKTSLFEQPQAQQQQQHNFSHDTSGLGLWASSPQSSTPPRASPSHGPGFVVPLDSSGGLGIVTFHSGRVQFGDQEPVLIEEARRRANRLEKERERERERERSKPKYDNNHNNNGKIEREEGEDMRRGRRRHDERGVMRRGDILPRTNTTNPYPTRNLIPTGTDLDALSGMVVDN